MTFNFKYVDVRQVPSCSAAELPIMNIKKTLLLDDNMIRNYFQMCIKGYPLIVGKEGDCHMCIDYNTVS